MPRRARSARSSSVCSHTPTSAPLPTTRQSIATLARHGEGAGGDARPPRCPPRSAAARRTPAGAHGLDSGGQLRVLGGQPVEFGTAAPPCARRGSAAARASPRPGRPHRIHRGLRGLNRRRRPRTGSTTCFAAAISVAATLGSSASSNESATGPSFASSASTTAVVPFGHGAGSVPAGSGPRPRSGMSSSPSTT